MVNASAESHFFQQKYTKCENVFLHEHTKIFYIIVKFFSYATYYYQINLKFQKRTQATWPNGKALDYESRDSRVSTLDPFGIFERPIQSARAHKYRNSNVKTLGIATVETSGIQVNYLARSDQQSLEILITRSGMVCGANRGLKQLLPARSAKARTSDRPPHSPRASLPTRKAASTADT
ncbi:hypothetical protein AOQ84DRAFT_437044 [Glonium stellatum]|uniref:Uncharacterized protein n=1 Tax=Glonium stellatum TaxID=574774 RepID=A0A8E2F886_9PEZI|nr:hypothetical protein AOQ84DRAFT_437044 [Glonium stellatum]